MHMTSAPHLLAEDRPEFERLLDEALRTAPGRREASTLGEQLNTEQLRRMALNAEPILISAAAAEYEHYVKVREELREPGNAGALSGDTGAKGADGAGAGAIVTVLAPLLAGTASVIFLLSGYALKLIEPEPAFAGTLVTAGWLFAGLTAIGILCAAIGLLLTALRNGATAVAADTDEAVPDEVHRAREAWRLALLERGILPFLHEALAKADERGDSAAPPHRSPGLMPRLGFSSPQFSSPAPRADDPAPRPRFSSPDYSGPEFGGPDHDEPGAPPVR
ncbi:hypothetical protein [Streptomyces sp. NPDC006879]|uniref:hypothetical protein n=1 Tax=Streptomyces sp. NPDC006879 TaxID=3364767 RepID=UPI0036CF0DCC